MRSAPKEGYLFGNKAQYRRNVWHEARQFLSGHQSSAQVALMPSSEGKEIEVALANGFKLCNMHIIDKNPAIVAHLQRRFPGIVTYGVPVIQALERMVKQGTKLHFANFDLCSHVDGAFSTLVEIGRLDAFHEQNLVFVTLLRGREQMMDDHLALFRDSSVFAKLQTMCPLDDDTSPTDRARIWATFMAIDGHKWVTRIQRRGTYRSAAGHQTMLYIGLSRMTLHIAELIAKYQDVCDALQEKPTERGFQEMIKWCIKNRKQNDGQSLVA